MWKLWLVHAYKWTITVAGKRNTINDKWGILKSCDPLTVCITETNNGQVGNEKNLFVGMPNVQIIGYSNNYWKHSKTVQEDIVEKNQKKP